MQLGVGSTHLNKRYLYNHIYHDISTPTYYLQPRSSNLFEESSCLHTNSKQTLKYHILVLW